jgi:hypothetical protein
MSQSYAIEGSAICSALRLVPLVLAALAATTSLTIAEVIKLVVKARLQVGGSQRYKIFYAYFFQVNITMTSNFI